MWIYTTPIVAQYHFGTTDPASPAYQAAANYVGRLFSIYNGVAAPAALIVLPWLARRIGKARTHAVSLMAGAAGFGLSGAARSGLADAVRGGHRPCLGLDPGHALCDAGLQPAAIKLGVSMGLFNVFVVVPQLLVATVMHTIMEAFFPGAPVWTMAFAAATLMLAALATLTLRGVD
jgi:maltose/moltooligosaccharide transporter